MAQRHERLSSSMTQTCDAHIHDKGMMKQGSGTVCEGSVHGVLDAITVLATYVFVLTFPIFTG